MEMSPISNTMITSRNGHSPTIPTPEFRTTMQRESDGTPVPSSTGCCRSSDQNHANILDGNLEAIAWALDTVATSIIYVGSGAFLATALIKVVYTCLQC